MVVKRISPFTKFHFFLLIFFFNHFFFLIIIIIFFLSIFYLFIFFFFIYLSCWFFFLFFSFFFLIFFFLIPLPNKQLKPVIVKGEGVSALGQYLKKNRSFQFSYSALQFSTRPLVQIERICRRQMKRYSKQYVCLLTV